jgi:hypothetical protein
VQSLRAYARNCSPANSSGLIETHITQETKKE